VLRAFTLRHFDALPSLLCFRPRAELPHPLLCFLRREDSSDVFAALFAAAPPSAPAAAVAASFVSLHCAMPATICVLIFALVVVRLPKVAVL